LTMKLVCESHIMSGTVIPNLGTLGLWVLELFAMYATDRQTDRHTDGRTDRQTKATLIAPFLRADILTDGQTDKRNAYCSFPTGGGIITNLNERSTNMTESMLILK